MQFNTTYITFTYSLIKKDSTFSQLCGNFRNRAANRSVCKVHWFKDTVMYHRVLFLALAGMIITSSKIYKLGKGNYYIECLIWDPTKFLAQWFEYSNMKINGVDKNFALKFQKVGQVWLKMTIKNTSIHFSSHTPAFLPPMPVYGLKLAWWGGHYLCSAVCRRRWWCGWSYTYLLPKPNQRYN